jgi:hypothetical protein
MLSANKVTITGDTACEMYVVSLFLQIVHMCLALLRVSCSVRASDNSIRLIIYSLQHSVPVLGTYHSAYALLVIIMALSASHLYNTFIHL